ncbi:MAG: ATP-binding protein [Clostridia bacterium]|nr:ATP-binding protein [Clostridia bacterium]
MGIPVLILGESGSGKSTSLRNFEIDEVGIFNVASKPLPFRKQLKKVNGATYKTIVDGLQAPKLKRYVIDDSQYLLCFELFDKLSEQGYQKFTNMAANFYNLVKFIITKTPEDVVVYFLHHVEQNGEGKLKAKTVGRMLDEKLSVEGLFSIVLYCVADGAEHKFITQSDGSTTAKSPMEMFPLEIDNDLKMVDTEIRNYYNLGGIEE